METKLRTKFSSVVEARGPVHYRMRTHGTPGSCDHAVASPCNADGVIAGDHHPREITQISGPEIVRNSFHGWRHSLSAEMHESLPHSCRGSNNKGKVGCIPSAGGKPTTRTLSPDIRLQAKQYSSSAHDSANAAYLFRTIRFDGEEVLR